MVYHIFRHTHIKSYSKNQNMIISYRIIPCLRNIWLLYHHALHDVGMGQFSAWLWCELASLRTEMKGWPNHPNFHDLNIETPVLREPPGGMHIWLSMKTYENSRFGAWLVSKKRPLWHFGRKIPMREDSLEFLEGVVTPLRPQRGYHDLWCL